MSNPHPVIHTAAELKRLMEQLRSEPVLALDTEASSFHRYHERLCLIQLSSRTKTWLIDPLAIDDMSVLGAALADPAIEWVIHDADYDLRMVRKMWGFHAVRVFDTMVSAEILNEPELGLAANLKKHFGVVLDKKFQKADWSKRPLPPAMLAYAAMDTTHLIALRDILKVELERKGRWSWAEEEFDLLVKIPFEAVENPEPGFLRLKGAKALKPRQLAVLRELFAWRDALAAKMDRAPFMVLGNDVLLDLSRDPPTEMKALQDRKGINENTLTRNGAAILQRIKQGLQLPKEQWPRVPRAKRWERDPDYEDRLKRLKQERDRLMVEFDLRPGIICSNHLLAEMARTLPGDPEALAAIPGMRRYQVREFGDQLLRALR